MSEVEHWPACSWLGEMNYQDFDPLLGYYTNSLGTGHSGEF